MLLTSAIGVGFYFCWIGGVCLWHLVSKAEQEQNQEVKEVNSSKIPPSMQPSIDNDAVPIPSSNDKMDDDVPTDPEGYNSEAKSVEGVDGQDSVRSSIHPPASSSKRSNQKGRSSCFKGGEQEERVRLVWSKL